MDTYERLFHKTKTIHFIICLECFFSLSFCKDSARNSITHNATVIANGLTHFGTMSDISLRENLDWLKRASNWAKFTATASLGVIHYISTYAKLNELSS